DPGFGTNNYYRLVTPITSNANLALGLKGGFTISLWILPRNVIGDHWAVGNDGPGGDGTLHFGLRNETAYLGFWKNDVAGLRAIRSTSWTHIACTCNVHGGQMAVYANGQLDASAVGRVNTLGDHDLLLGWLA